MRKLAAYFLLLAFIPSFAFGQSEVRLEVVDRAVEATSLAPIDHVTDRLNRTDDARRALESFHEARRLGIAPAAKGTDTRYEIGATRDFLVHVNNLQNTSREAKTFELKGQSTVANVWVEVGELANGNVADAVLSELEEAMLSQTPDGSYNPNQGIIANNNEIFGNPPNVDGDASPVVDVLLYNIPDQNTGSVLAGFVWSGDLCTDANAGMRGCNASWSNQADVLYLDTNPLLTSFPLETLLEVAAHEYQHLIHFAYDEAEETFVNEGLSEWAERLNGYRARTISYLSAESERNISLFTWRDGSGDVLKDYQRAGLFTTYLAERLGPKQAGNITQRTESGAASYRAVLQAAGVTLEDVILDFHTANLLNDRAASEDGRFGYGNPYLQNLIAPVSAARVIDGRTMTASPPSNFILNGGGGIYVRWEFVSDLTLNLSLENAGVLDFDRARMRVIVEDKAGDVRVVPITVTPSGATATFSGDYDAITLVAAHVKPVSSAAIGVSVDQITVAYDAVWGGGQQVESEIVQYDQGQVNGSFGFYILNGEGMGVVANRFEVPSDDAVLGRIYISPYFMSQFSNGDQLPEAPRDVELRVWADDGNGLPGAQLYARAVTDGRDFSEVLTGDNEIRFHAVDLLDEVIPTLPPIIHVGYSETGVDENYLVMGVANYLQENVSFVGVATDDGIAWTKLWDRIIRERDGEITGDFSGKALPIRVEFLTGAVVSQEEELEVPGRISLDQNYPNPFNPVTSITYEIPQSQHVRLGVFDVTGRRVASLVDDTLPSGQHVAHFDGTGIASGVYLYVLETENTRVARKMLLVK